MVSKLYKGTLIANVKMDRDRGNRLILTVSAQFDRVSVGLLVGVPSFSTAHTSPNRRALLLAVFTSD